VDRGSTHLLVTLVIRVVWAVVGGIGLGLRVRWWSRLPLLTTHEGGRRMAVRLPRLALLDSLRAPVDDGLISNNKHGSQYLYLHSLIACCADTLEHHVSRPHTAVR
jgi:hypothetical protein